MVRKPDIESGFEDAFERLARGMAIAGDELFVEVLKVFRRDAQRWDSEMAKKFRGRLSLDGAKPTVSNLSTRTGSLRNSLGTLVRHSGTIDSLELRKFSTSPYAVTHELGTRNAGGKVDLRPKKAQALAIPQRDAMTRSGVPREPGPRSWEDTFVYSTPEHTGNVLGFIVKEDEEVPGELMFLYLLYAGAPKIPPRLGMRHTHETQEKKRREEVSAGIHRALRRSAKKGKGGAR